MEWDILLDILGDLHLTVIQNSLLWHFNDGSLAHSAKCSPSVVAKNSDQNNATPPRPKPSSSELDMTSLLATAGFVVSPSGRENRGKTRSQFEEQESDAGRQSMAGMSETEETLSS